MFCDLLNMDISGEDLMTFEQTAGLFEQKLHSMTTVQKYWYEQLADGTLRPARYRDFDQCGDYPGLSDWSGEINTVDQYEDYLVFADNLKDRYPLCGQQFGISLCKMCTGAKKVRARKNRKRINIRRFPPLKDCRTEFDKCIFCPLCLKSPRQHPLQYTVMEDLEISHWYLPYSGILNLVRKIR